MTIEQLQRSVYDYYQQHGRADLPWRTNIDPYAILVSEVMLQQTQVNRVVPKFTEFMTTFPDVGSLAQADLSRVLAAWSGLGYNRRARFLRAAAQEITTKHDGQVPTEQDELVALPGIGVNTAGAIRAYAFNQPAVYIETNIRAVFIHRFFPYCDAVDDSQLLPLIEQAIDRDNPRRWYWALMDYGTHLKQSQPNPSRRSRHYTRQSVFEGSRRQLRAAIIKHLLRGSQTVAQMRTEFDDERLESVLADLEHDGLVQSNGGVWSIA